MRVTAIMQFTRIAADLGDAACLDSLTGLANRLLLGDRLASAFARQIRRGGRVLVAVLDVDLQADQRCTCASPPPASGRMAGSG